MRRFNFLAVILVAILVAGSLLVITERAEAEMNARDRQAWAKTLNKVRAQRPSSAPEGTGTIQYDPGAPNDTILASTVPSRVFGNIFNSRSGSPLSPGTVTQVSFYAANTGGNMTSAIVRIAPLGGAPFTTLAVTSPAIDAFNAVPVSVAVGPSFFVGVDGLRSATGGGFSGVPVGGRSASYAGQGFHGVRRTPGGVPSVTLSGINAMVRASGNIVIPVELLEFEIE